MTARPALVALIPARGGSKRLPGKNVRDFFGHPVLAYAVAAARNSRLFDRVLVSTDDPRTGQIARRYGAEYLPRPQELATDDANLIDVAAHALESLASGGIRAEAMCQLMPNCPLRTSSDIREHYRVFQREGRRFQISVVPYRGVYPHWALAADENGHGRWLFGSDPLVPSQSLADAYCPTGAIWWVDVVAFLEQRAVYGKPFQLAPMDPNRGIDIDHRGDWDLAELLVRGLRDRNGVCPLEPVEPADG